MKNPELTFPEAREALRREVEPERARVLKTFFKTGKGEYGEGDRFIGVTVPRTRAVAKRFHALPLPALGKLLDSSIHEERLLALIILYARFKKATDAERRRLYAFYIQRLHRVNNWDLVDASAHHIVGAWHADRGKEAVYRLARSEDLWERRVAMVSCWHEIREKRMAHPLEVARLLVADSQDLIQKAVGWMLREIGNRDPRAERRFLDRHAATMPRTMLRYAIERFPERERRHYMGLAAKRLDRRAPRG